MRLSRQLQKIFKNNCSRIKNMPQVKINDLHPLKSFCVRKLLRGWNHWFLLVACFLCAKNCSWEIFEFVSIASIIILLMCTPFNPPTENLFACNYFYLWELFFSTKVASQLKTFWYTSAINNWRLNHECYYLPPWQYYS